LILLPARSSRLFLSKLALGWGWLVVGFDVGIEDSKDCNAESPSRTLALGPGWLVDLAAGIAARNDSKAESPSGASALPVPSLLNPRWYFLVV
jgi:hypothetical protein